MVRNFDEIDFLEAVLEIKRAKVSQGSFHSSIFLSGLSIYACFIREREQTMEIRWETEEAVVPEAELTTGNKNTHILSWFSLENVVTNNYII